MNPLERAKLKSSLIQLGEDWLYELCVTLQVAVPEGARSSAFEQAAVTPTSRTTSRTMMIPFDLFMATS